VTTKPLSIKRVGLVTGVGLDASTTCAAIRGAIDNFQETRFRDQGGEWIMGCEVPFTVPVRGEQRLIKMAARAVRECLDGIDRRTCETIPLLLCLAEATRPGRIVLDDARFFSALEDELGFRFHAQSTVISNGHVAVAVALRFARDLIGTTDVAQVLVVACDSLLVGATLADCERRDRLLTSQNSDGFIPGEGAAALLVEPLQWRREGQLVCHGLGFAVEKAHIDSEQPLRADGLTAAIKQSLSEAGCGESILEFKIIDASGGQYVFKEASLAFSRIDRTKRSEFDVWHPADCIGEVGAAIGLVMIAVLKAACEKAYAKGTNALLHLGNDDGRRASMIFSWHSAEA
jgi:3-oxoacyl-[acyl-carrier-protein] synthase I